MTGNTLIRLALGELGVISPVETPSAEQAQNALAKLNLMVDSWRLERSWLFTVGRVTKTLTANVASYSIGTGADINTPRPDFAPEHAGLILNTAAATPVEETIEVITDQRWQGIVQKTLTASLSLGVYFDFSFDPATGFARVWPWPIPNVSNTQLVLYLPTQAVTQFANLSTNYLLAPGYGDALYTNLAIKLGPSYGRRIEPDLRASAMEAKTRVEIANARTPELRCDDVTTMSGGTRGGVWDWRLGDFR